MKQRAGTGWQTALADLSLILFMLTAAALSQAPAHSAAAPPSPPVLPALGEPVAVWRDVPGAPPLGQWLTEVGTDPQLRLTIVASTARARAALALAASARRPARIVLESEGDGTPYAALTYDQAEPVARALH